MTPFILFCSVAELLVRNGASLESVIPLNMVRLMDIQYWLSVAAPSLKLNPGITKILHRTNFIGTNFRMFVTIITTIEQNTFTKEDLEHIKEQDSKCYTTIENYRQNAAPLQDICRGAILRNISIPVVVNLSRLPLPKSVIQFLLWEDFICN